MLESRLEERGLRRKGEGVLSLLLADGKVKGRKGGGIYSLPRVLFTLSNSFSSEGQEKRARDMDRGEIKEMVHLRAEYASYFTDQRNLNLGGNRGVQRVVGVQIRE